MDGDRGSSASAGGFLSGGGGPGSVSGSSRRSLSMSSSAGRRRLSESGFEGTRRTLSSQFSMSLSGERTVKRLRLSKALTIPENTSVHEVCRRMAARRVDAVLLTDSNALLCGILTDKDIATRVIAREFKLEDTPVSRVMTRNPVFVLSDTLAVEALQKMVQGKFRHLPVVESGEVIALLDITKCLYDAIARMERAAEKGRAIAAAVEGVEKNWGAARASPNNFVETIREQMFRPSLSTVISENPKVVTVSPSDTVLTATKKMLELKMSSAVVTIGSKPQGILTSRDILMRVIAQNQPPATTTVDKVMTPNPGCVTIDTPILNALHIMHDGKFLHLPVVDRDGNIVSVVDVIHITHAAVTTVGNSGAVGNEAANSMMQSFWDSALELGPLDEEDDCKSDVSLKLVSDSGRSSAYPYSGLPNTFGFKLEDRRGRKHRFNCDIRSLAELVTCILQRVGDEIDRNNLPQILYEDEDRDKVVLASDSDLQAAVEHAMMVGWKGLRLYLDYSSTGSSRSKLQSGSSTRSGPSGGGGMEYAQRDKAWATAYSTVAASAALIAGLGVMAYLKRSSS